MIHQTLKDFLTENKISPKEFAILADLSIPHTFRLIKDPNYNICADTARRIAAATKEKFGKELDIIYYK